MKLTTRAALDERLAHHVYPAKTFDGKVVEVDGIKYELKAL